MKQRINDFRATGTTGGGNQQGTNWDKGLRQVAAGSAANKYDQVIVITDGNPTLWSGNLDSDASNIADYEVEEAVHSADWLKNLGVRVVTIGVENAAGNLNSINIQLISGPQVNDDYYITEFEDLANVLREISSGLCGAVVVQKQIVGFGGRLIDETPAGWAFTGRTPAGDFLNNPGFNTRAIADAHDAGLHRASGLRHPGDGPSAGCWSSRGTPDGVHPVASGRQERQWRGEWAVPWHLIALWTTAQPDSRLRRLGLLSASCASSRTSLLS